MAYDDNFDIAFEDAEMFAVDLSHKVSIGVLREKDSVLTDWLYSLTGLELASFLRTLDRLNMSHSYFHDKDISEMVVFLSVAMMMEIGINEVEDNVKLTTNKILDGLAFCFFAANIENMRRRKWVLYEPFGFKDEFFDIQLTDYGKECFDRIQTINGITFVDGKSKSKKKDMDFKELNPKLREFFAGFDK